MLCDLIWSLSDTFNKAAREKASFSISLQCAFEPAVFTLFVYENNISFFKFKFGFTLRRVGHHNSVSEEEENIFGLAITETVCKTC